MVEFAVDINPNLCPLTVSTVIAVFDDGLCKRFPTTAPRTSSAPCQYKSKYIKANVC